MVVDVPELLHGKIASLLVEIEALVGVRPEIEINFFTTHLKFTDDESQKIRDSFAGNYPGALEREDFSLEHNGLGSWFCYKASTTGIKINVHGPIKEAKA